VNDFVYFDREEEELLIRNCDFEEPFVVKGREGWNREEYTEGPDEIFCKKC
jgi:hypothetical protein